MNRILQGFVVAALAAFPMVNAVAADSDFSATIGLKAWVNNWSKWGAVTLYGTGGDEFTPAYIARNWESENTTAWIPSASVRYKDFMAGGSYFKQNYGFGSQFTWHGERKEYDLVGGYYVLPTLAIIGGYKKVDTKFVDPGYPESVFVYSGPIVGFSASAPLTGGFSLYGTAAIGVNFKRGTETKHDADYRLGELGVAYSFDVGGAGGMKGLIGTLGYRSQVIVSKLTGDWEGVKGRDTTEGMSIGIIAAF